MICTIIFCLKIPLPCGNRGIAKFKVNENFLCSGWLYGSSKIANDVAINYKNACSPDNEKRNQNQIINFFLVSVSTI